MQAIAALGTALLLLGGLTGPAAFADDASAAPPVAAESVPATQDPPAQDPADPATGGESDSPVTSDPDPEQPEADTGTGVGSPAPAAPAERGDDPAVDPADEPAPAVNVQIESLSPQEQGVSKVFEYLVEFSCVSTRSDCTDVVIDVPFTQTTPLASDALPTAQWPASLVSDNEALVPNAPSWDLGKDPRQIVLAAPLQAGTSASVRIDLQLPRGRVANGTAWEIAPVIRASGAEATPAPAPATSQAVGAGRINLDELATVGGVLTNSLHPGATFTLRLRATLSTGNAAFQDLVWADLTRPFTISAVLPAEVEFVEFPEGSTDGSYDPATRAVSWQVTKRDGEAKWMTLRIADDVAAGTTVVIDSATEGHVIGVTEPSGNTKHTTITILSNDLLASGLSLTVDANGHTTGSGTHFIAPKSETSRPVTVTASLAAQHRATVSDLAIQAHCIDWGAGVCETPEVFPTEILSVSVQQPDGGTGTVDVVLTLSDGSTETIPVGATPVSLAPWVDRIERVEATGLALPVADPNAPPVPSYVLSLEVAVPDDGDVESGERLRTFAYATIAAADDPEERVTATQTWSHQYLAGVLHAPIYSSPVIPGWSLGEKNVELESWTRWSAPDGERRDAAAMAILVPAGLEFTTAVWEGQTVERVENFAGTGRTLVRFPQLPGMRSGFVRVDTQSLPPGIYDYEVFHGFAGFANPSCTSLVEWDSLVDQELLTGVSDVFADGQADDACHAVLPLVVTGNNTGQAITKSVRGDLDTQWVSAPGTLGVSDDGTGTAEYRLTWANTGPTELNDVVVYDLLPGPNDSGSVGQLAGVPRQSDFAVTYEDVVVPAGFSVAYSVSDNPCRPELGAAAAGCVDDWTATVPADPAQVRALRFTADAAAARGASAEFLISVSVPEFGEGQAAMNTAAAGAVDPGGKDVPSIETPYVSVGNVLRVPEIGATKKSSVAEGTQLRPGDTVDYTLTIRNDGTVPGEFGYDDVLTEILDDATLSGAPAVTGSGSVRAEVAGELLEIRGVLGGGETATVSYTVTVTEDAADRGDDVLRNTLVLAGDAPADTCESDNEMCTVHTVLDVAFEKAADPASGTEVSGGQEVSYTLTARNLGHVDAPVSLVDHLDGVLDDAELVGAPVATDDGVEATLTGTKLAVTGTVAAETAATVTYTVRVLADTPIGEPARSLDNFLVREGVAVPEQCTPGIAGCTTHPIAEADAGGGEIPEPPVITEPPLVTDPPTGQGPGKPAGNGQLAVSGAEPMPQVLLGAAVFALLGAVLVAGSVLRARRARH